MTEDSPPALVLHDDDIWVWRGGRVLGPRNFPLILGVLSIPLVVVCGSVALSGKPRAALDYFVVTLCIVAMIMMLFARFTAFSRVIEIRAAPDRIRLKFAWGVRRTYPTSDLKNLHGRPPDVRGGQQMPRDAAAPHLPERRQPLHGTMDHRPDPLRTRPT